MTINSIEAMGDKRAARVGVEHVVKQKIRWALI
jgi:hypothetical protein